MDRTLNQPEVCTIDTAVLLASSGVFDGAGRHSPVGALTRVGGMTLFQRTVFTLQRGGISRILTLVGEEEPSLRSLMHGDDRLRAALRWLPIREFPPSDPQTWDTLANEIQGSCLLLSCHMVFSPSLIESLRDEGREGGVVMAIGQPGDQGWEVNPGVVMPAESHVGGRHPRVIFPDQRTSRSEDAGDERAPAADLVVLPVRLFRKSGEGPAADPIRSALEQAAAEGAVQVLSAVSHGYQDVRGPGGRHQAERLLFRSLESVPSSLNGFIDRYVNRKLSRVFTPFFIKLGFSANAVTMVSMVIGLMGAACFALGSYQFGVLGALLFQLAVILDCCDGEVARLTFAESRFGEELDIVADNVVHMAIFAGIAWGAYLEGPWHDSNLPLGLGALAVVGNGMALWLMNRVRSLKADPMKWQRLRPAHRARFDFILDHVANRDFSIVVFACACVGVLPWFLWLGAVGSTVFAGILAWNLRRALMSRQS